MEKPAKEESKRSDGPRAPEQILTRAYPMVQWILERVARFPKTYRFSLGERLSLNSLEVLELITEALYTRSKLNLLTKADRHLTRLRILLRLAMDTKCLTARQHEFVTKEVDEVGRMLGGWIKQQRKR